MPKTLLKIAVTGGIASGKSCVCKRLVELGASFFDADAEVHRLLASDDKVIQNVLQLLGPQILKEGHIDRKAVAEKVFANPALLKGLETILHPLIIEACNTAYAQASARDASKLFVAEVPLLFEMGYDKAFDWVIYIDAEESVCLKRYLARGGTKEQYELRMKRLIDSEEKKREATIVLQNNGDKNELFANVDALFHRIGYTRLKK